MGCLLDESAYEREVYFLIAVVGADGASGRKIVIVERGFHIISVTGYDRVTNTLQVTTKYLIVDKLKRYFLEHQGKFVNFAVTNSYTFLTP